MASIDTAKKKGDQGELDRRDALGLLSRAVFE